MPKPHPIELRERVVAHVEKGHSHRSTAVHFSVSIKFVNDMMKLKRTRGDLRAKPHKGTTGRGKLAPYKEWIYEHVRERGDITLAELCFELHDQFGLRVNRWSLCRLLHQMNMSHKKKF